MYEAFEDLTIGNDERVECGVITGPDPEWAERIESLLSHKGAKWNWQNSRLIRNDEGVETRYYVLHRAGDLFANIMTVTLEGVGIFGHVWTRPEDRRKGACSALMPVQMEHFRQNGGRALFLGTGFGSTAYRIYSENGFRSVEPGSGAMSYFTDSPDDFENWYFQNSPSVVEPLCWRWPSTWT